MSKGKSADLRLTEYYDNLYTLGGAVLDRESYLKHKRSFDEATGAASDAPNTSDTPDPFAQPQDLRQLAAQAFEADARPEAGRREYRPETVESVPTAVNEAGEETGQTVFVPGEPTLVFTGSGSYYSSGSYQYGSGSYRYGSGSFAFGSGSYSFSTSGADDLQGFGGYGLGLI